MSWNTTTWIIWSTNENKELADRFFTYMGFERADRVFYFELGRGRFLFYDIDKNNLLSIANALFPCTTLKIHESTGCNADNSSEDHYIRYDAEDRTIYYRDEYECGMTPGPDGCRGWEKKLVFGVPKTDYIKKLISLCKKKKDGELTALLEDLLQRIENATFAWEEPENDDRKPGVSYNYYNNVDESYSDEYDEDEYEKEVTEDDLKEHYDDYLYDFFKEFGVTSFGSYPQTKDGKPAPIEWFVLKYEDGCKLLLSMNALDCKRYHDKKGKVTWKDCSLRKWLNEEFYDTAFNEEEKKKIIAADVRTHISSVCSDAQNSAIRDNVFVLSSWDYEACIGYRIISGLCRATDYVKEKCKGEAGIVDENGISYWCMRSSEQEGYLATYDYYYNSGDFDECYCIRPCIWVRLDESDSKKP